MANTKISDLTVESAPPSASDHYVAAETDVTNTAVPASMITLEHTAVSADSDQAMAVGKLYLVDMSGWASDNIFSLPTTAKVGERIGVYIVAGNGTYNLQLRTTAASNDTINGVDHDSSDWDVANTAGDYVVFKCITADTAWMVEHDATGDLQISGNLILQSGKGIDFSATSDAAGSTSELLDDYEEGTWTPVLSDGTNNATSTVTVGHYVKIGRLVHAKGRLITSSLGSVSGDVRITGLPYTSSNMSASFSVFNCTYAAGMSLNTATENIGGYVVINGSHITLRLWDSTLGQTNLDASEWGASGSSMFDVTYYV